MEDKSLGQKSHAAADGRVRTEDWRPPSLSLAAGQAAAILHTTTQAAAPSTTAQMTIQHTTSGFSGGFKLIASDS